MPATPVMAVSFIGILVLLGLVVGGVVLLVSLLANKRTRLVGFAMLGLGGVAVVLGVFAVLGVSYQRVAVQQSVLENRARVEAIQAEARLHSGESPTHNVLEAAVEDAAATGANRFQAKPERELTTDHHALMQTSWLRVIVILLALGAVFGVMKLLNSERSGLIVVAGVLAVAVAGVVLWRFAGVDRPVRAVVADHEAWDQVTRPRIDLSDKVAQADNSSGGAGSLKYTVVANGRELTFDDDAPIDDAIEQVRAIWLKDGHLLRIETGNESYGSSGGFSPSKIGSLLHEARKLAREKPEELAKSAPAKADAETVPADTAEPSRPAWVDNPPKRIGKVYRQVVEVGPYQTSEECYRRFPQELVQVATEYSKQIVPLPPVTQRFLAGRLNISTSYLMQEVCVDEYLESYHSDAVGQEMKRLYVQVEFDDAFRQRVEQGYATWKRRDTMELTTMLGVVTLVLIGGVFGLLKIDEATKGYYSKRLFLGVPAAIIGVTMLLMLLNSMNIIRI